MKLGKIIKINDLRTVWKDEARDFTPWLSEDENLESLGDEIGIDMELVTTEARTGAFSTDILANETNTSNKIVIENQLETTDHDHLGKLITYASGHEAKTVIWIVKEVREEHRQAVDWLNEHTDEEINIFLCKIELWQINDSEIAPKFQVICRPNNWTKTIKNTRNEVSPTKLIQYHYWEAVKEYIENNSKILKPVAAQQQHWYDLSAGSSLARISLTVNSVKKCITCAIYIPDNKELFNELYSNKKEIESDIGLELTWDKLEGKKAARIDIRKQIDPMNKENWKEAIKWHVKIAEKLHNGFSNKIREFN